MDENEDESVEPSEVMAEFISQFMSAGSSDQIYRKHYCDVMASKIYNQFGLDGMAEMMMSMDRKAEWISDIILESADLENIMFKKYGTWDANVIKKTRGTKAMQELNEKLWRLRRKYAKLIVEELMEEPEIAE